MERRNRRVERNDEKRIQSTPTASKDASVTTPACFASEGRGQFNAIIFRCWTSRGLLRQPSAAHIVQVEPSKAELSTAHHPLYRGGLEDASSRSKPRMKTKWISAGRCETSRNVSGGYFDGHRNYIHRTMTSTKYLQVPNYYLQSAFNVLLASVIFYIETSSVCLVFHVRWTLYRYASVRPSCRFEFRPQPFRVRSPILSFPIQPQSLRVRSPPVPSSARFADIDSACERTRSGSEHADLSGPEVPR